MKGFRIITFSCFIILLSGAISPVSNKERADQYVDQYLEMAIQEENLGGIPVAIKLGQALLETNYGKSKLLLTANNHFGLKCKDYWSGKTHFQVDDDRNQVGSLVNSCFRRYNSAEQSYSDHTNFLKRSPAYKKLFTISQTDYRAWALELQNAGYATDKRYASKLINIIESNGLDKIKYARQKQGTVHKTPNAFPLKSDYKRGYFVFLKRS